MMTLMSSEFRAKAWAKFSGRSRLVMRRPSQERSARARASRGLVPVPLVGVDTAEHDVVFQHRRRRDVRRGDLGHRAAMPNARETHHAARPDLRSTRR